MLFRPMDQAFRVPANFATLYETPIPLSLQRNAWFTFFQAIHLRHPSIGFINLHLRCRSEAMFRSSVLRLVNAL